MSRRHLGQNQPGAQPLRHQLSLLLQDLHNPGADCPQAQKPDLNRLHTSPHLLKQTA
jgi:hypothetical protein